MKKKNIYCLFIFCISCNFISAQLPSFPGAEGFGALASGGRGGSVYHVTSLNDEGVGTLRDAVSKPNRTVVFDVAGIIKIKERIDVASNITIAGQTAPGEGIVVYGNGMSFSNEKNIIARYLRMRGSVEMPKGKCVLNADSASNIIFDHISVEWGRWDDLHIKESTDITLQYCLIGEPIDPQRFGALLEGPENLTIHHCLWIDNQSRNPKAKAGIEYINNVVYNWGVSGFVGGHSAENHYQDVINNYFIAGPNSNENFLAMFTATDHVYQKGNYVDLDKDGTLNGKLATEADFVKETATIMPQHQNVSKIAVTEESAEAAYKKVLEGAGASLQRDAVDLRIIGYLRSLGKEGKIFRDEASAGGQPALKTGEAKKDSDGDGIPDDWEKANKLNAKDAADANKLTDGGYTYLEKYLNGLVQANK